MRIITVLAYAILSLVVVACSGVDIQHSGTEGFIAKNYHYYKWRTEPLPNNPRSDDPIYALDPIMRKEVNAELQLKGYVLDESRAEFTVDYLYATGLLDGERSDLASNITPYPHVTPNRRVDQATVDNAIALGGVKPINSIVLQFNDRATNREVWQVTLSKFIEDANNVDATRLDEDLKDVLQRALKPLPTITPN